MNDTNDTAPIFAARRPTRPRRRAAHRSAAIKLPIFAGLVITALCLLITLVVRGSEPADSGWSVATPTSVLGANQQANPQVRIAINHLLEQGRVPILQAPAQQSVPQDDEVVSEETAEAAADGWRPAHIPTEAPVRAPTPHFTGAGATVDIGARFRAASASSPSNNDDGPALESAPTAVEPPKQAIKTESAPAAAPAPRAAVEDVPQRKPAPASVQESPEAKPPVAVEEVAPEPLPPLSKQQQNLRAKVRRVLKSYYNRPLNSRDNDPWETMHGMLAYGVHSRIRQGGPQGKTITAVGWLCFNRPCKGMTLLYATPDGDLRAKQGVGLQGHMGQFLAMLAQCQVAPDYPIRVRNREYTISDLIEAEKETCYPKSELTFKLIALMHYLDTDATWVNDQGQSWDIPRLIREELAQPIRGAACGGTHRLAGLSLAARTRVRRGEPLDGEYLRASQFVEKYHNYAFQMQNRDGSLSTEWFRGRGAEQDINRRVKTTGHILEWLLYSVDDDEVRSARTFRAVNYLASLLANNYNNEWEVGPMSHAIHALRLYDERLFQPYDGQENIVKKPPGRKTAKRPSSSSRSSQR